MTGRKNDLLDDDSNWVEVDINVSATDTDNDDFEVEIQDDPKPAKKPQPKQETPDDEDEEDTIEASEEQDEPEEEVKNKKSRAQDRIRQLNAVAKAEKAAAEAARRELAEIKKQNEELRAASVKDRVISLDTEISGIDAQIASMKKELKAAHEEGDSDAIVELSMKLDDLTINKRVAAAQKQKFELQKETTVTQAPQKQQQQEQPQELPKPLQNWLGKNMWIGEPKSRKDLLKKTAALDIARELEEEGYDPKDRDFYQELDVRLEAEFGAGDNSGVEYTQESSKKSPAPADGKQKGQGERKTVSGQSAVIGASRTPAGKGTKVSLTRDQVRIADKMFSDIADPIERRKEYARWVKKSEASPDGWVTLT